MENQISILDLAQIQLIKEATQSISDDILYPAIACASDAIYQVNN